MADGKGRRRKVAVVNYMEGDDTGSSDGEHASATAGVKERKSPRKTPMKKKRAIIEDETDSDEQVLAASAKPSDGAKSPSAAFDSDSDDQPLVTHTTQMDQDKCIAETKSDNPVITSKGKLPAGGMRPKKIKKSVSITADLYKDEKKEEQKEEEVEEQEKVQDDESGDEESADDDDDDDDAQDSKPRRGRPPKGYKGKAPASPKKRGRKKTVVYNDVGAVEDLEAVEERTRKYLANLHEKWVTDYGDTAQWTEPCRYGGVYLYMNMSFSFCFFQLCLYVIGIVCIHLCKRNWFFTGFFLL